MYWRRIQDGQPSSERQLVPYVHHEMMMMKITGETIGWSQLDGIRIDIGRGLLTAEQWGIGSSSHTGPVIGRSFYEPIKNSQDPHERQGPPLFYRSRSVQGENFCGQYCKHQKCISSNHSLIPSPFSLSPPL